LILDAYLQKPLAEQRQFCEQAQAVLNLPAASIEKDFWVCWAMRILFALPKWGTHLTLKGGTSLSKGWKLIRRFSEDIDVVVDRGFLGFGGAELSANRRRKLVKTCGQQLEGDLLPAMERAVRGRLLADASCRLAMSEDDKDRQTMLLQYPTAFAGSLGYVQPVVKIEFGARSDTDPSAPALIQSYLSEALPGALPQDEFSVRTVSARRTFWEKVMLLHEETFRPIERRRKARLSRHYYDLWCLIQAGIDREALDDQGLFELIAAHRAQFFEVSWVDYSTLKPGSLRLIPPPDHLAYWQEDYRAMRQSMFFGETPELQEILDAVGAFERRANAD
jgi:predicted nucleotidyltransferase component of viral defense system